MAVYSKLLFSGSTNGRNIKVATNASPGTLIHTAVAGTSSLDEIFIYCQNSSASDVKLTIEFGGTTAPDDLVEATIPAESGPFLVVPGWLLQNSCLVRAFAATADVLLVNGYVNRIA